MRKTLKTFVWISFTNSASLVVVKSKIYLVIWTPCKDSWGERRGGEGSRKVENPWTRMLENPPEKLYTWTCWPISGLIWQPHSLCLSHPLLISFPLYPSLSLISFIITYPSFSFCLICDNAWLLGCNPLSNLIGNSSKNTFS